MWRGTVVWRGPALWGGAGGRGKECPRGSGAVAEWVGSWTTRPATTGKKVDQSLTAEPHLSLEGEMVLARTDQVLYGIECPCPTFLV